MSYLVLARKYRPTTFAEVVEQQQVTQTLTNAVKAGRVAHAVIFAGPRGTGKTTIARILAKAMNCENGPIPCNECRSCREITSGNASDVFEIDGASNNGVEQVRELRSNVKFMPAYSPYKIYIIDEVHMLSLAAFNALLKTLEEPPAHVMFLFATTEPHKIPATILSRCQRHDLGYVSIEGIINHLSDLCEKEAFTMPTQSLELIGRQAGGSIRDAMSLLDQVMSCSDGETDHDRVMTILGVVDNEAFFNLSAAVLEGNIQAALTVLDDIHKAGHDIKKLYTDMLNHFRNLLVVSMGETGRSLADDLPAHDVERLRGQTNGVSPLYLNQVLSLLLNEEEKVRFSSRPKIAVEMALIKIIHTQPALPVDTLIEKIDALKNAFLETGAQAVSDSPAEIPAGRDDVSPSRPVETATERPSPAMAEPLPPPPPENHCDPAAYAAPADAPGYQSDAAHSDTPRAMEAPAAPFPGDPASDPTGTWEAILTRIDEQYPLLGANLRNSTLSRLNDDEMEIEVYGSETNKNMLTREKSITELKNVCRVFFKKDMTVTINHKLSPVNKTPAQQAPQKPRIHPLVKEALDVFGGEVVSPKTL
ncbi:MAG: DNA polymerase III subunit gamma/tau [Thermodesulfobacteriota bacterium]|nr:DNA polymerase III subunit gamma/tau [Thermodesulfobacteriota bacterium]